MYHKNIHKTRRQAGGFKHRIFPIIFLNLDREKCLAPRGHGTVDPMELRSTPLLEMDRHEARLDMGDLQVFGKVPRGEW